MTPGEAQAQAGLDEVTRRQQLEAARAFVHQLLRAQKQVSMYRHAEAKFAGFVSRAFEALRDFTSRFGALRLKVELSAFTLHGEGLLGEESLLPYAFFKDGIRALIFQPTLTLEELVALVTIFVSEPGRGADAIYAQLWQAQLPGFEVVLVEGFRLEELGEDEVQVEVDAIVEHLESRLRTSSDDALRFARISQADVDARLEDVGELRGLVLLPRNADDALREKIARELEHEAHHRLLPKVLNAVFTVIERGIDDAGLLEEIFVHLLDTMLLQSDFGMLNLMVAKLRALSRNEAVGRVLRGLLVKMGDEQRLHRVGESLRLSRPARPEELVRYLGELPSSVVPTLLDVLDGVEAPESRALLVQVLATFLPLGVEPFLVRLQSDRPAMVRDVATLLERAGHPERVKWFTEVLRSPSPAIRRELVAVLGSNPSPQMRAHVVTALDDEHQLVRSAAARALPEFGGDRAFVDLMRVIRGPQFAGRAVPEREAFYGAVAASDTPAAFTFLLELVHAKGSLFNRARAMEEKLMAIKALADAGTVNTLRVLTDLSNEAGLPVEVLGAARQGVFRIKKAMFGDSEAAPTSSGSGVRPAIASSGSGVTAAPASSGSGLRAPPAPVPPPRPSATSNVQAVHPTRATPPQPNPAVEPDVSGVPRG